MRMVFKALPFGAFHTIETARWLEEQAQQGLLLCGTGGYTGILRFEKTDPCRVRYHVECANRGEPAAFVRDDGSSVPWVALGAARGMRIYRCDDSTAPEPSYDPDAEVAALRRERTSALFYTIAWAVLAGMWLYDLFVPSIWISLTDSFAIAKLFLIVAFAGIVLSRAALLIGATNAVKRWETDGNASPSHRAAGWYITTAVICGMALILSLVTALIPLFSQPSASFNVITPTVQELIDGIDPMQSGSTCVLTREFSLIAPTQFSLRQQGDFQLHNGGIVYIDMAGSYYETLSPEIARQLVEDLAETELMSQYEDVHILDSLGIDYAAVDDWSQMAYLQHGNKVLVIDMGSSSDAISATLETLDWVTTAAEWLQTQ